MSNSTNFIAKKLALVAALLGISLLWIGCGTTGEHINWYQGPQRATNEVGLLTVPRDMMNGHTILIRSIDGTNVSKAFVYNNSTHIELLPGNHTLGLWFLAGTEQSLSEYKISFNCEAGHVYGAYMSPIPNPLPIDALLVSLRASLNTLASYSRHSEKWFLGGSDMLRNGLIIRSFGQLLRFLPLSQQQSAPP